MCCAPRQLTGLRKFAASAPLGLFSQDACTLHAMNRWLQVLALLQLTPQPLLTKHNVSLLTGSNLSASPRCSHEATQTEMPFNDRVVKDEWGCQFFRRGGEKRPNT